MVVKAVHKVVVFEIRIGLLQREKQTKLNSQIFGQIGQMFFEKLLLKDSLYLIVFANILIKLMRKIGKKWS